MAEEQKDGRAARTWLRSKRMVKEQTDFKIDGREATQKTLVANPRRCYWT